jgi:signal transduction histidine kinase
MAILDFGAHRRFAEDALAITEFIRSNEAVIADVLRVLSQRFDAFGGVLWELTGKDLVDVKLDELAPSDEWRLFTVASWFDCPGPPFAMHNLPVFDSKTGEALRRQKPLIEPDLPTNGGRFSDHPFLKKCGITQMVCVPMTYRRHDGRPKIQSLNLYRKKNQPAFGIADSERLEYNALLVNSILDSLEDSRAVRILLEIDSLLLSDVGESGEGPLQASLVRFEKCCSLLARLLNCCEVSLFLSRQRDGDEFMRPVTTLKFPLGPISEKGLTRWVLKNRKGIRILDLTKFAQDRAEIQREYDNSVEWTDTGNVRAFAKAELGIKADTELPPLSFMAAPVLADNNRYGVIRCSVRRSGPSYFSDRDLKLLTAVATRLGLTWRDALLQDALHTDRVTWEHLAMAIDGLNAKLQSDEVTTRQACIQETLNAIPEVLPQVDIVDVRLAAADRTHLEWAGAKGQAWLHLPQAKKDKLAKTQFPLGKPFASVGAEVFDTGTAKHVSDTQKDPSYASLGLIPTKEMVVAPISSGDEIFGVLDLHRTANAPLPKTIVSAAKILASQLGLYLRMHYAFQKEKATLAERDRTYQDLSHQLKTPLTSLAERTSHAAEGLRDKNEHELATALVRIRGLARQSLVVAQSMQLLADLNRGLPIKLSVAPVTASRLRQMLIEIASDVEAQLPSSAGIHIDVNKAWLSDERWFQNWPVRVDWRLLRQCVSNLLDNAGKYCKSNSIVKIETGISWRGLEIQVENRGIRLEESEVDDARKRDWRSPAAIRVTGEGQGVGLWIVDQVMKAHHGELNIAPTNADGITKVALIFPPQYRA